MRVHLDKRADFSHVETINNLQFHEPGKLRDMDYIKIKVQCQSL